MATQRKPAAPAPAPAAPERKRRVERTVHDNPLAVASGAHHGQRPAETRSIETVTVHIPHDFTLTLDDHKPVPYKAGTAEMPLEDAEHWWSKANGVAIHKRGA